MKNLAKFFEFKEKEPEIAKKWQESGVYKFSPSSKNSFKIDTPPPTVSGYLHMGHVFSYVQTDIIARYKRMMGFEVFYPIGFDDNGLPTERLVEKLTGKKVGRNATKEEFVNECYKVVDEAEKEFESLFKQIGLSCNFELKYQTIAPKTAEISQKSFIDLYNKGLVFKKLSPVYFDVVDKTALAQADIEDKEMEGDEVIFRDYYTEELLLQKHNLKMNIQIMTTRAEMIPACVCVLYNPKDERYNKLQEIGIKEIRMPITSSMVKLIADEEVSIEKGTGLVMCCAYGDMQDKVWIERHKLAPKPILLKDGSPLDYDDLVKDGVNLDNAVTYNLISDEGRLLNNFFYNKDEGKYMKVEEGRKYITQNLGASLVSHKKITHTVKCGERSGKPVEILLKEQWYVSLLPFKRDLLEVVKKIDFYPAHMKVRLVQWIEGLNQDWCISRERFFGINIPVRRFRVQDTLGSAELMAMKEEVFKEVLTPLITKAGGKVLENFTFEIKKEALEKMLEGEEYLSLEDDFTKNCFDLQVLETPSIEKYKFELVRNFDLLFKELLEGINRKPDFDKFRFTPNEVDFVATDLEVVVVESLIKERGDVLKELGISSINIESENLVLDTWFTSSLTPSVAWGSFEETPIFEVRPQAHEIIRTWAFYTICKTYLHSLEVKSSKPDAAKGFNSREFFRMKESPNIIPWKNVMLSGWCLASDKTKMSKSKGNVITPSALIAEKGVDVIRFWCGSSTLGMDTAYSEEVLENGKKLVNKLWNAFKFVAIKIDLLKEGAKITEGFDVWILSRLGEVVEKYKNYMNAFEYSKAKEALDEFFWKDLCDNYLEIIKVRFYGEEALKYKDNPPADLEAVRGGQQSCLKTLDVIFDTIIKLYAPFVPFVTDELYRVFKNKEVHAKGSLQALELPKLSQGANIENALKVIDEVRRFKTANSLAMNAMMPEFKTEVAVRGFEPSVLEDLKNVTGVEKFV